MSCLSGSSNAWKPSKLSPPNKPPIGRGRAQERHRHPGRQAAFPRRSLSRMQHNLPRTAEILVVSQFENRMIYRPFPSPSFFHPLDVSETRPRRDGGGPNATGLDRPTQRSPDVTEADLSRRRLGRGCRAAYSVQDPHPTRHGRRFVQSKIVPMPTSPVVSQTRLRREGGGKKEARNLKLRRRRNFASPRYFLAMDPGSSRGVKGRACPE